MRDSLYLFSITLLMLYESECAFIYEQMLLKVHLLHTLDFPLHSFSKRFAFFLINELL